MPQLISIPIPVATYQDLKAGVNYWPDLKANFFAPNQFTPVRGELHRAGNHGAKREEHEVAALKAIRTPRPAGRRAGASAAEAALAAHSHRG